MGKLEKAKALAEEWAERAQDAKRSAELCARFDGDTPHQLIGMWESGKNLQERPLSQFEAQAVAEAWCRVFGELPPDCGEDGEPDPPPEPRAVSGDARARQRPGVTGWTMHERRLGVERHATQHKAARLRATATMP